MHRFEIFNFKNAVTLKTGLGSIKIIGNVTIVIERILLPIDVL